MASAIAFSFTSALASPVLVPPAARERQTRIWSPAAVLHTLLYVYHLSLSSNENAPVNAR